MSLEYKAKLDTFFSSFLMFSLARHSTTFLHLYDTGQFCVILWWSELDSPSEIHVIHCCKHFHHHDFDLQFIITFSSWLSVCPSSQCSSYNTLLSFCCFNFFFYFYEHNFVVFILYIFFFSAVLNPFRCEKTMKSHEVLAGNRAYRTMRSLFSAVVSLLRSRKRA